MNRLKEYSKTKRINVSLPVETVEKAKIIGNGNLSAGLRIAVKNVQTKPKE